MRSHKSRTLEGFVGFIVLFSLEARGWREITEILLCPSLYVIGLPHVSWFPYYPCHQRPWQFVKEGRYNIFDLQESSYSFKAQYKSRTLICINFTFRRNPPWLSKSNGIMTSDYRRSKDPVEGNGQFIMGWHVKLCVSLLFAFITR